MSLPLSGSQTVGPYFAIGLAPLCAAEVAHAADAKTIVIEGRLLDGNSVGVPDGFLEIWQADGAGAFGSSLPASAPAEATGFGRIPTDAQGAFRFITVRPAAVPYDTDRLQAPHLLVLVFMRGLLRNLVTRLYLPDDPANLTDPVLQLVPQDRRATLIARAGEAPGSFHWDIVLRQQEAGSLPETVFFAW